MTDAAPRAVVPLTPEQKDLVERHLDVAEKAAAAIVATVDQSIPFEDLVSHGHVGLIDAAKRYDPSIGTPFPAYAWQRVMGAIKDGLRASSEYTKAQRQRFNDEQRIEFLRQQKANLSDTLEHLAAFIGSSPAAKRVPLEEAAGVRLEGLSPESMVHHIRIQERIRKVSEDLETVEREIVNLYYFEHKNLEEAGAQLGLTKSWASRLLARATKFITGALGGDDTR
jgi:RNA polymerase sigma factor for flagellar operon FliA